MLGANMSGAEHADTARYPSSSRLSYHATTHGLKSIRFPFKWERLQPTLGGPLDPAHMTSLKSVLSNCADLGMTAILDCHSYGRHSGRRLGSEIPSDSLAQFWALLLPEIDHYRAVAGYDIMNEPHSMEAGTWPAAAQAAVDAIRASSAKPIYVEGTQWSGAHSWLKHNADLHISGENIIYSAHQYFDVDSSGKYSDQSVKPADVPVDIGVQRLAPFLSWLDQHGYKGHIGEFGAPTNDPGWVEVTMAFVVELDRLGIPGHIWAGGLSSTSRLSIGSPGHPERLIAPLLVPYFSATEPVPEPEPTPVPEPAPIPEPAPEPSIKQELIERLDKSDLELRATRNAASRALYANDRAREIVMLLP